MTLDLIVLVAVLLAGVFGAIAGAAKQVANLVALVAGYLCAKPLGTFVGPRIAHMTHGSRLLGIVAATLFFFLVVTVAVRYVLTHFLRRLLAGKNKEDRGPDRALGFGLGAVKVLAIAYVILSGLAFVSAHVEVAGRHLGISPKDSLSFAFVRRHNLFDLTEFSSVRDLVGVADALQHPSSAARIRKNPAFRALMKDPRFRKILADQKLEHALLHDHEAVLLRNNTVLELLQDPEAARRLSAALAGADGSR